MQLRFTQGSFLENFVCQVFSHTFTNWFITFVHTHRECGISDIDYDEEDEEADDEDEEYTDDDEEEEDEDNEEEGDDEGEDEDDE